MRVMENIVDSPGHFLVRPIMPPVFWTRHVAWAITTSIDIHQLVSVASSSPRGPVGARSVPIGLQVYVLSLNVMSRPARSPRPPDAPPRRADAGEAQAARARAGGDARLLRRPHQVDLLHLRRGPLHRPAPPRPAPPRPAARARTLRARPFEPLSPSAPAQGAPEAARPDTGRGGRARGAAAGAVLDDPEPADVELGAHRQGRRQKQGLLSSRARPAAPRAARGAPADRHAARRLTRRAGHAAGAGGLPPPPESGGPAPILRSANNPRGTRRCWRGTGR